MDIQVVKNLYRLISDYSSQPDSFPKIIDILHPGSLENFHQWADKRKFEGGFLITTPIEINVWVLLSKWNKTNGYYIVLFPEDRSGPIAEIHNHFLGNDGEYINWRYKPSKRDDSNLKRKEYFKKYFSSLDVTISLPTTTSDVTDFLNELISLADNRDKADRLAINRPLTRDGFPEGKIKERLHKSRERNSKLITLVKAEALAKNGKLECECCGFDFYKTYGDIGSEFIEAHHTKPISELHESGEETRKEDIALVCSNCHRMLHRRRPWLKMAELDQLTDQQKEFKHDGT